MEGLLLDRVLGEACEKTMSTSTMSTMLGQLG